MEQFDMRSHFFMLTAVRAKKGRSEKDVTASAQFRYAFLVVLLNSFERGRKKWGELNDWSLPPFRSNHCDSTPTRHHQLEAVDRLIYRRAPTTVRSRHSNPPNFISSPFNFPGLAPSPLSLSLSFDPPPPPLYRPRQRWASFHQYWEGSEGTTAVLH